MQFFIFLQRGMSFIEALIAISISTTALLVVSSSVLYVYKANNFALEQASAVASARRGIERSVQDIREAAYSDEGAYPISAMGSTTLTFYSDIDNDTSVERLRYFLDTGELRRGVIEASGNPPNYNGDEIISIVSRAVRNEVLGTPLFTYYDAAGVAIDDYTSVTDVRFVNVQLTINLNPLRAPNDFELRSSAALRNSNK